MQRFRNLLLIHESGVRGRKARSRAIDLAVRNQARIKLLEVAEPLPQDGSFQTVDEEIDLQDIVAREMETKLDRVAGTMAGAGLQVKTGVSFGNPYLSILREVQQGEHDLVLVTAEGDGGLKEHLFGSLSRHLLRKCPVPVWVVRPARSRRKFRVLAAVNPAEEHPTARSLDRTVLEMASSLARMYHGHLDVVHAWQPVPRSGRVGRKVVTGWNNDLFLAAEMRLVGLLDDFELDDLSPHRHLPGGPAGLSISEVAEECRSDIIVMGTLNRSGLRGMIMGNTCETVLQHINASVLAVKPEGFESPVTLDSS